MTTPFSFTPQPMLLFESGARFCDDPATGNMDVDQLENAVEALFEGGVGVEVAPRRLPPENGALSRMWKIRCGCLDSRQ